MSELRLLDSNILIDYLRDADGAVSCVERDPTQLATAVMVEAELYAGLRDEEERRRIELMLGELRVFSVGREVAVLGGLFKCDYQPSHGTGLADALIAATAEVHDAQLVTLNEKHFPMLDDVIVPY
jgi:predicted nucleic acid-binding protein